MNDTHTRGHGPHRCKHGKGPSSFWMHDPEIVFRELRLEPGYAILDLGCGPGDYALKAAGIVGNAGTVYALDKWQYLLDGLAEKADARGLGNIETMAGDLTASLPVETGSIDVCLLSTVLHIFDLKKIEVPLFGEIKRVLKPHGRVAIIECKKEDQPFGPPRHMRLSPDEIGSAIRPFGFETARFADLGYNYMIQFSIRQSPPVLP